MHTATIKHELDVTVVVQKSWTTLHVREEMASEWKAGSKEKRILAKSSKNCYNTESYQRQRRPE